MKKLSAAFGGANIPSIPKTPAEMEREVFGNIIRCSDYVARAAFNKDYERVMKEIDLMNRQVSRLTLFHEMNKLVD